MIVTVFMSVGSKYFFCDEIDCCYFWQDFKNAY